jgi:hypothetical protein
VSQDCIDALNQVGLLGVLSIPYTGGADGASQALSNFFNNHGDPSMRASKGVEHPRAVFIRTDKTEMIRYRYPTPKGTKLGEIVLRSADSEKTKQVTKPKN